MSSLESTKLRNSGDFCPWKKWEGSPKYKTGAVQSMPKTSTTRRSRHSQECNNPRRHGFLWLVTLTFDPTTNGFLGLMVEHFYVKFGESCSGFLRYRAGKNAAENSTPTTKVDVGNNYTDHRWRSSFVRSLLRAGVQPTLDPSAEICILVQTVQCASQGRGGKLVGVGGVCVRCVYRVEEGTVGVSSLSGISKRTPSRRGLLSG